MPTHATGMMTARRIKDNGSAFSTARSQDAVALSSTGMMTARQQSQWQCHIHGDAIALSSIRHQQPAQQHSGCAFHWSLSLVCRPSGGGSAVDSFNSCIA